MKNKRFWAIFGAIVGIIILAGVLFAFVNDNNKGTELVINSEDFEFSYGDIGIRELNLIKNYQPSPIFDEYAVRSSNEYGENETIEVYYVIEGIKAFDGDGENQGKRLVSYSNKVTLIGSRGEVLDVGESQSFSLTDLDVTDKGREYLQLPVHFMIPTNTLNQSGYYLLEVEVRNLHYGDGYKDDIEFIVR